MRAFLLQIGDIFVWRNLAFARWPEIDHRTFEPVRLSLVALKLALVTETFLPEINGVAMTLFQLVEGLSLRGHLITVIRPRQHPGDLPRTDGLFQEILLPGFPVPGYPLMRLGFPLRQRLIKRWRFAPPDIVHIATEGPLGYAALSAARALQLPVSSS